MTFSLFTRLSVAFISLLKDEIMEVMAELLFKWWIFSCFEAVAHTSNEDS